MKILKDGGMGFYASKWNYLLFLSVITAVMIFFFLVNLDNFSPVGICVLMGIIAILLLFLIRGFFDKTPLVKLTADTVEIRGCPPLLWEDIGAIGIDTRKVKQKSFDHMCFDVRDLSLYKLTLGQKSQKIRGFTHFEVSLDSMSKKERGLFEQAVRSRFGKDIGRLSKKAFFTLQL